MIRQGDPNIIRSPYYGGGAETEAAINRSVARFQSAQGRYGTPMDAGMIGDHKVEIVGPNMIRTTDPQGGSITRYTTGPDGRPVPAHIYLASQTGFAPSAAYTAAREAGIRRATGYPPEYPAPRITGTPGNVFGVGETRVQEKGGVSQPIQTMTPQERIRAGAGTTMDYLRPSANPAMVAFGDWLGRFKGVQMARNYGQRMGGDPYAETPAVAPAVNPVAPAGQTTRQAARITTPTQAQPVPQTETSPVTDINQGKLSTMPKPVATSPPNQAAAPTTLPQPTVEPDPELWKRNRYAYEGL